MQAAIAAAAAQPPGPLPPTQYVVDPQRVIARLNSRVAALDAQLAVSEAAVEQLRDELAAERAARAAEQA